MEKEESCGQEVLFTYLQEQISPQRWVLREEGKFILTVHRNRYGKKCGFAEGKMLLGWSVHMNSIHEPRKRKQAQSYRTREVYPTGTSPSTPSRPQRSQSSSTVEMTRSTSPRWKLNWSGPAAVWSQRARTALSACTMQAGSFTGSSGGTSGGVPLFTRASTLTVGGNQLDGLLDLKAPLSVSEEHPGTPNSRPNHTLLPGVVCSVGGGASCVPSAVVP